VSKLSERRKEIREYTVNEADQELARLRRQLFDLRIQQQRGEVKNNRQFTQVRTDIARVLYQLTLLELAEEEEVAEVEEEAVEEEEAAEEGIEEIAAAEAAEEEEAAEERAEEEAAEVKEPPARPSRRSRAEKAEAEEEA
jgi:ribosomal protein L29